MNHCGTQRLETKRLVLRRLTESDANAMFKNWTSDPEVTRFLTWPPHTDVNVTEFVIGTWLPLYEKEDYYHWAITLKETEDEPIGTIHGLVNDDLDQITIGYCLGRAWWHQGIMSEATQAVIDFFFDRVNANSICSYHDPNNPHSGMVMKHCGMKYEGTRRASDRNNTGISDISWYSILQTEYRDMLETDRLIITENTERMAKDIRYACSEDRDFWLSLDKHISEEEFDRKVRDQRGYVLTAQNEPVGLLRYSLFWDNTPFCNLLYVAEDYQKRGYGRMLMEHWERDMHIRGYDLVMTSTQADENAQHFYRALGYRDCGGFILPFPGHEQPMEIILAKTIGNPE